MARCNVLESIDFSNLITITAELGLFIYNGIIWSAFDVCSIVTNICNKLHSIYSADEAIHQEDYFCGSWRSIPELITAALIDASPFNASLSNCPLAGRLYTACADTAADIN
ncbi:hypothetical protein T4D_9366 [Trichinella pseudospiralis]|uniref:Uncharacterized protein n=1 Tax=Trichinella pseudospiralis TaxID=6337 RepID=A0A0V1FR02_TRIPS|nr:hypothetical protein T4D_9366 [Trichinella pseudospiralis]